MKRRQLFRVFLLEDTVSAAGVDWIVGGLTPALCKYRGQAVQQLYSTCPRSWLVHDINARPSDC